MHEGEVTTFIKLVEPSARRMQAEIDGGGRAVGQLISGIGAVGGDAQIGGAGFDEIRIGRRRDEIQPVATTPQMQDDQDRLVGGWRGGEGDAAQPRQGQQRGCPCGGKKSATAQHDQAL